MRRFCSFWWTCVTQAFRRNTSFANSWPWMFGVPAASFLASYVASVMGVAEVTSGNAILDAFLTALVAFIITWLVAFILRLIAAPAALYNEEKDRADRLSVARQSEGVLAEIGKLRAQVARLRIEMEQDNHSEKNWVPECEALRAKIAEKIKEHSNAAEAENFTTVGNLRHASRVGFRDQQQ